MKHFLILLIIGTINVDLAYTQENDEFREEEFLVEVFYDDMTENSKRVYINKYAYGLGSSDIEKVTDLPYLQHHIPDLCNTEIHEAFVHYENVSRQWNEDAPIFQQPKYKKIIFVDDIYKLSKRKQKRAQLIGISKPLFLRNREYALVVEAYNKYYRCFGWSWKKPWKSFRCGIYTPFLVYHYLSAYQKTEGKWVRIASIEVFSEHL